VLDRFERVVTLLRRGQVADAQRLRAETLETTSMAFGDLHGRAVLLIGTDGGAIRWYDSADLTELTPPGRFAQHTSTAGHTADAMNWPAPGAVTHLRVTDTTVFSAAGDIVTSVEITTGDPAGPTLVHPGRYEPCRRPSSTASR
jgi:hypothetical protein